VLTAIGARFVRPVSWVLAARDPAHEGDVGDDVQRGLPSPVLEERMLNFVPADSSGRPGVT
jgi:hypothetical protein